MRLFYAIKFSREAKNYLLKQQEELDCVVRHGQKTKIENLHLTLHFIGEAEENEVFYFKQALNSATEGITPFFIKFTSFGSFRQRKEDLIYVKIKNSNDTLQKIVDKLKETGRGDMRSFFPHVTMVRKAETNYTSLKIIKKKRFNHQPFKIDTVHLMQSKTIDKKPFYSSIHSVKLIEKIL